MNINSNSIKTYEREKDSKFVNVFMTIYMCTVLLFTQYASLNTISLMTFVIAFGSCAIFILFHGKNFRYSFFHVSLAMFLGFCAMSLLWASDMPSAQEDVITVAILLIMSVILFSYISIYRNIDVFIKGIFISGLVCAYVVIGYHGFAEYIRLMLEGNRLGGEIANVNTIGMYMATSVIICFYYGYIKKKRGAYIVMLIPLLVGFGTGSRKALIMMALGVGFIMFMQYRENINMKTFGKLFFALVIVICVIWWITTLPIAQGAMERVLEMLGLGVKKDASASQRMMMTRVGWEYFLSNPAMGIGIGNSWLITLEKFGWETYLHNNYIELLASVGIFGTIIYYSMHIYLLKELYRLSITQKDSASTLMFVLVLLMVVMDYGMVSYYDKMTFIYLSMAAGTVSIGRYNERKAEEEALLSESHPEES